MTEFIPFPKIPRLNRDIVITEKIDGTNASVLVPEDDGPILAASRTRWLTPGKQTDNYGFAKHVQNQEPTFRALGPGHHFGEWWGQGIQRGYGLTSKRFSLFNTGRWNDENPPPAGIDVVPVLYAGPRLIAAEDPSSGLLWHYDSADDELFKLVIRGSQAAPGFMKPEGIVVYHSAAGQYFKATIEGDEKPKGQAAA